MGAEEYLNGQCSRQGNLGNTLMVYVQDKKGFAWGFAAPTIVSICSIFILEIVFKQYRKNLMKGVKIRSNSILYKVITEGARKLNHIRQYRFFDKAAEAVASVFPEGSNRRKNRWKLFTATQVLEEFKCFLRALPIWASTLALYISFAQLHAFFTRQASIMDRSLGKNFTISPWSVLVFSFINAIILISIYKKVIVPFLRKVTGNRRGITSLQHIGVGLFVSIFAMVSAALVENMRKNSENPLKMSVLWLFPQFFLIGSANMITYLGKREFCYYESTVGKISLSRGMFMSDMGIGPSLGAAIIWIVEGATGGENGGWIRDNLDEGKLDYYYWVLAGINGVNFLVYLYVSSKYKGSWRTRGSVIDQSLVQWAAQMQYDIPETVRITVF